MQPIPVLDTDPPPRDRTIQQRAAARAFVEVLGRVGDAVRRGEVPARDELRQTFAALAHAGIEADDAEHAIATATSLLADQVVADLADRHAADLAALNAAHAAEREQLRGDLAATSSPRPSRVPGPATFMLERVRALLELGDWIKVTISGPRAAICEVARQIRVAAPGCGVASSATLATTIELAGVAVEILEPVPPVDPAYRAERAAAAGRQLEHLEQLERGARHGE